MAAVGDPVILARMPGYVVATATETSDSSTFTTTETVIGTITASLISGVTYIVAATVPIASSVANDRVAVRMREDNVSGTQLAFEGLLVPGTDPEDIPAAAGMRAMYTAVSTGSKTFVVTGDRYAGTGNIRREALSTRPLLLTITVA